MKASKILDLLLIPGIFGTSLGICSPIAQKKDILASEQKALEVIESSTDMNFLLKAQKALEIRKYDLYTANHDQASASFMGRQGTKFRGKRSPMSDKCSECHDAKNSVQN